MKVNEKEQAFKEVCDKIDAIKMDLFQLVGKLESAGAMRKAKSLDKIIGELERWEHTKV